MLDPLPPRTARRGLPAFAQARPATTWTAALLFFFGGLGTLMAVIFPVSPQEPTRLDCGLGVTACVIALGLWIFGRTLHAAAMALVMAVGALMVSVIVANAHTSGGAMLTAYAYPWIAVYTAHFCSRRVIVAQVLWISVGFGGGLILSGLPNMTIDWVLVTGTVWSTAIVLGKLSESLRQRADTDQLTGLLNRSGFLAAAARERAIAERSHSRLTVAVLDLNGFKQVNDRHGHAAGDRLLADLGLEWRKCLRAGDILARHGGDEFVLLLPATAPAEAERALARLANDTLPVDWSVGLSEWLPGEELDACLARADRSLYGVKQARVDAGAHAGYPAKSLLPSV